MAPDSHTLDEPRPLRRDAVRNRALILAAAAEVFAERGLEAGYDEIARRAGVGVGTVYRRFPERAELVEALFETRIEEVVAVAEESADYDDPWDGLSFFLHRVMELQVADRGLKEAMTLVSEARHQLVGPERLKPFITRMLTRAKVDGVLRKDVEATDLGMLLALLSSLAPPEQPDLWRRYIALALEGMRARPGQERLPLQSPTDKTIHYLMHDKHRR